ncbi:DoxX family protein [Rufibacter quisquiliarum]|uniref:Putative membrane protein YphA (DoxX/SURF4 family) n=1 Tax=Rufibacter quisquiliarum TaxID=1549639 RepID=A0A839GSX4_9BACT|nr:DoxX family protein [Rufibacter quisquiliarum]MBA9076901.1 putative membrane protein YphA (DoxX/SURF4 family) [Rufibacter quisquiliarum]
MKQKLLTGLSLLFGLLLINGGLNKFFNYMPVPENLPEELVKDSTALMEIAWLMPLIGFAEVLGGILIIFPKTRALGALVIFPVMVGVLLTHLLVEPTGLPIALVIWAILLWIIYENRKKYLPMVS